MAQLPVIRVIDPGPVAYRLLPDAGDEDLERQLDARYGARPDLYRFRLVDLPLSLIAHQLVGDIAAYAEQEDGPRRMRLAESYRDAYLAGEDPPAIVVVDEEGFQILDGFHRAAGAQAAGRSHLAAWDLLPD